MPLDANIIAEPSIAKHVEASTIEMESIIGNVLMEIKTLSIAGPQFPAGSSVVSIRYTKPVEISELPGT